MPSAGLLRYSIRRGHLGQLSGGGETEAVSIVLSSSARPALKLSIRILITETPDLLGNDPSPEHTISTPTFPRRRRRDRLVQNPMRNARQFRRAVQPEHENVGWSWRNGSLNAWCVHAQATARQRPAHGRVSGLRTLETEFRTAPQAVPHTPRGFRESDAQDATA